MSFDAHTIPMDEQSPLYTSPHTHKHTCMHTHTNIHTYTHAYTHTHIRSYEIFLAFILAWATRIHEDRLQCLLKSCVPYTVLCYVHSPHTHTHIYHLYPYPPSPQWHQTLYFSPCSSWQSEISQADVRLPLCVSWQNGSIFSQFLLKVWMEVTELIISI